MTDVNLEAVQLVNAHGGIKPAARAAGIPENTLRGRYRKGLALAAAPASDDEIEFPHLPESELSAEEMIDYAKRNFAKQLASREARRWMEFKVRNNRPIGLCVMGDPHIDSSGCNWPLLHRDIQLLAETPGMYAVGGNDITDNWIGRLQRLYADSKMSKKQAWKLVKWLFKDSKVRWLIHVEGNHDSWGDGSYLLRANAGAVPVEQWQARFKLVFPNETEVKVNMAHDFKGHSQWNHLHGAQKEALLGEQADIYACAHRHCWAMHQEENAQRGYVYWLARARGYKFIDSFADVNGFGSQRYGASITAIIDPTKEGPGRISCFADLAEAAEFLTWLRARQ